MDFQTETAPTEDVDYETFCLNYGQTILNMFKNGATAFACSYDLLAKCICTWLESNGIRVPEDVSVIGFDSNNTQLSLSKRITTIEQDFYTIGYKAAEMILQKIEKRNTKNRRIKVPVRLMEGDTVRVLTAAAV